jgi:hypothetical protein
MNCPGAPEAVGPLPEAIPEMVFKSGAEVIRYLQGCGLKLKKSKFYDDRAAGKFYIHPDGTVHLVDLQDYISNLRMAAGKLSPEEFRLLTARISLRGQIKALLVAEEAVSNALERLRSLV